MHINRSSTAGHDEVHLPGLVHQCRLGFDIDPAFLHTNIYGLQIHYNEGIVCSGIYV